MIARSSVSRNRRGLGLPGCGRGVAAPISMKPPAREHQRRQGAGVLGITGSKGRPGSAGQALRRHRSRAEVTGLPESGTRPCDSAVSDRSCARSGSSRCSASRLQTFDRIHAKLSGQVAAGPRGSGGSRECRRPAGRGKDAETDRRRATVPTAGRSGFRCPAPEDAARPHLRKMTGKRARHLRAAVDRWI